MQRFFKSWDWESDRGVDELPAGQAAPPRGAVASYDFWNRLYRVTVRKAEGTSHYDYLCDDAGRIVEKRSHDDAGHVAVIIRYAYDEGRNTVSEQVWSTDGSDEPSIDERPIAKPAKSREQVIHEVWEEFLEARKRTWWGGGVRQKPKDPLLEAHRDRVWSADALAFATRHMPSHLAYLERAGGIGERDLTPRELQVLILKLFREDFTDTLITRSVPKDVARAAGARFSLHNWAEGDDFEQIWTSVAVH